MKFRIVCLRLIASSYGDAFTPDSGGILPHVLGMIIERETGVPFQQFLDQCRLEWDPSVTDGMEENAAMDKVRLWIGKRLTELARASKEGIEQGETNATYTLEGTAQTYRTVRDQNGNVIAHDTVTWVYEDAEPVEGTANKTTAALHLFACCIVSLEVVQ